MKISIFAVGRLKQGPEVDLFTRYRDRVDRSGKAVALGPVELIEIAEAQGGSSLQRCDSEAKKMLDLSRKADIRIALDENGKSLTSRAFGALISDARDDGCGSMAFLIGGADGHGALVKENSGLVLSLSKMTLPHGMARIFLVEQIYRAITIISGHPYHRD